MGEAKDNVGVDAYGEGRLVLGAMCGGYGGRRSSGRGADLPYVEFSQGQL